MYSRQKREAAEGIAALEGYLLCQAEVTGARREAETFADRLPWLTSGQREEVIRLYTDERIALSRRILQAVADRCHELRGEYTARYHQLRRRLWAAGSAVLLGAAVILLVALSPGLGALLPSLGAG